jgi:uncharacterized protein
MVATRQQVFDTIARHQDTLRSLGVRKLQLFGSAVRDEVTANSDLDFVIELANNTLDSYMGVKFYLEDVFGCPVDLVLKSAIKPRLRDRILTEAIDAPGF